MCKKATLSLFPILSLLLLAYCVPAVADAHADADAPRRKADEILIEKGAKRMTLLRKGRILKAYKIALGRNPVGPKVRKGDGKTPEGVYKIDYRNPKSAFHLSLHISYPNPSDLERAKALGVSPGGEIMIHGLKKGPAWISRVHHYFNWTEGCVAVTNEEIDEIWRLAPNGTRVEIRP